jgi:hypothetical protein
MKGNEFAAKVKNKEITNGSMFEVIDPKGKKLFEIGVLRGSVSYFPIGEDQKGIDATKQPNDLFTSDKYTFNQIEE